MKLPNPSPNPNPNSNPKDRPREAFEADATAMLESHKVDVVLL